MESTYGALYRALGKPVIEHHDMCYRRIRWECGCTASGLSPQKLNLKTCVRHRLVPMRDTIWMRR
jgi:hypothetical protein